jgi:hypothetical protein
LKTIVKYLKRPNTDNPTQAGKVRKYNEDYTLSTLEAFGFIENSGGKPMCVFC